MKGIDGFPQITPVVKLEHEKINFGGLWHTDTAYLECPPMATMLIAREMPPVAATRCSPTCISPTRPCPTACGACSTGSSRSIPPPRPTSPRRAKTASATAPRPTRSSEYVAEHPVVRTHPETGRKALYVNGGHTVRFKDMTEAESAPLLQYLFAHQQRPEFTCRFRWEVGLDRALGQSLHPAQPGQRLSRLSPRHASRDPRRRQAALNKPRPSGAGRDPRQPWTPAFADVAEWWLLAPTGRARHQLTRRAA